MNDVDFARRWDIVLIRFPFSNLAGSKLRPALVLARSREQDLLVGFITSRQMPATDDRDVPMTPDHPEFVETGLRVASTVRLDKLASLHPTLLRGRIGAVGPQIGDRVNRALRAVLAL